MLNTALLIPFLDTFQSWILHLILQPWILHYWDFIFGSIFYTLHKYFKLIHFYLGKASQTANQPPFKNRHMPIRICFIHDILFLKLGILSERFLPDSWRFNSKKVTTILLAWNISFLNASCLRFHLWKRHWLFHSLELVFVTFSLKSRPGRSH